jgi:hypothetical protein
VGEEIRKRHSSPRISNDFTFQTATFVRGYSFAISPRIRARFCWNVLPPEIQRAQGMPGAQCTRSLVCDKNKHTSVVTTGTPEITRHSPRNGFTAYSALSPVSEFLLSPSLAD